MAWEYCTSLFLLTCLTVVLSAPLDWQWNEWKQKHGRSYGNKTEEDHSRDIWINNFKYIMEHNRQQHPFKLGLNGYADMVRSYETIMSMNCVISVTTIILISSISSTFYIIAVHGGKEPYH